MTKYRVYQYKTSALDRLHSPSEAFPDELGFNKQVKEGQFVIQRQVSNGQWRNFLGPYDEEGNAETLMRALDEAEAEDQPDFYNLVEDAFEHLGRFESDTKAMTTLAEAIGYGGRFYASPIDHMLSDNPGMQEAMVNWLMEQDVPEWRDSLQKWLAERQPAE